MAEASSRRILLPQSDWVQHFESNQGIECIEAYFRGNAYARHRHDTYAIGRTLSGVQSFHYRGGKRDSLAGHTVVLHPDEPHDGQAGTKEGFRYRMIYLDPALLQEIAGGKSLPFIEGGVTTDPRLSKATAALLEQAPGKLEGLELHDAIVELALALDAASGAAPRRVTADYAGVARSREYLLANWQRAVTLDELAEAAGRDRWSLSRDFRTFFGTSPHRYLTMRRLDAARRLMLQGRGLAEVAATAGFADQSHMTRHFKKAYGLAPAQWLRLATSQS